MKKVKVSIIVPIFNVDKYLEACLDSLICQTLKDIEIICVNDGSTDNSLSIIYDYMQKDSRIKVIDKANAGYGHTMNRGLEVAKGEFIGIVESDDFIKNNMFEVLYTTAIEKNVDIVKSSFMYFWGNKDLIQPSELLRFSDYYKVVNPLEEQAIFWLPPAIWSAIYKRDIIESNSIRFLETPGASYQDTSFNFKVLACAKSVYLIPDAFLFYRQDNMASSVNNKAKVYCVNEEFEEIESFLDKKVSLGVLKPLKNRLKFGAYRWNLDRIDQKFKDEYIKQMGDEFKKALTLGEMDRELFTDDEWVNFDAIAHDKKTYKFKHMIKTRFPLLLKVKKILEQNKR